MCLAFPLYAAEQGGNEIDFLESGLGARPLAMGEAYTAVANDVNAIQYNPAGMMFARSFEFGSMQAQLASGFDLYYIAMMAQQRKRPGQPIPDSAFGVSWVNGSLADIPLVTQNEGVSVNTDVKPYDYSTYQANALSIAYASWLMPNVAWGLTTTAFYKDFSNVSNGQGYGITLMPGLMWMVDYSMIWGVVLKDGLNYQRWNTGTEEVVHPELRIGLSWEPFENLIMTGEARQKLDARYSTTFHGGTELSILNFIRLRAGYSEDRFTAGCGLYVLNLSIHYAYNGEVSAGIGDSHRISLEVKL